MGGEALYYGLNALSSNMIMVDRKKLKNPNGLILGTPGSGFGPSGEGYVRLTAFGKREDCEEALQRLDNWTI